MRFPFIPVDTDTGVVFRVGFAPGEVPAGGDLLFRLATDSVYGAVPLLPDTAIGDTTYLSAVLDSSFLVGDLVEYYFRLSEGALSDATFLHGGNSASYATLHEAAAVAAPFTFLVQSLTGIAESPSPAAPARNALLPNRPNPFNPSTTIPFALSEPGRATVALFDSGGRLVRTLLDETLPAGWHAARWDGRTGSGADAPSGIYFAVLRSGPWRETAKLLLVR
jgi:hypothetical protein